MSTSMSTNFPLLASRVNEQLHQIRKHWCWLFGLGAALMFAGIVAIAYPAMATLTTVGIFGYLLVICGVMQISSAIWAFQWGGFFLHLLSGLLYLFLGMVIIERPELGAAGYTLMLAMFFVAAGLFRIIFALSMRFSGWGWMVVSGIVTLLLGILVWRDMPQSALWVIGTFVGIELMFTGLSWVMLGLALKRIPVLETADRDASSRDDPK